MTTLTAFLRRHRRTGFLASVFIYQLEANDRYLALTDAVFAWIEQPGRETVTSTQPPASSQTTGHSLA